jgi:nitrogen regulatory protein PII 2
MKEIIAIVRMNKIQRTKDALLEAGYHAFHAAKVLGRGKQRGFCYEFNPPLPKTAIVGSKDNCVRFIPKRMLTIVVNDESVKGVVNTIIKANQTGHAGDGKIFVSPVDEAIRIRTGEKRVQAIN